MTSCFHRFSCFEVMFSTTSSSSKEEFSLNLGTDANFFFSVSTCSPAPPRHYPSPRHHRVPRRSAVPAAAAVPGPPQPRRLSAASLAPPGGRGAATTRAERRGRTGGHRDAPTGAFSQSSARGCHPTAPQNAAVRGGRASAVNVRTAPLRSFREAKENKREHLWKGHCGA